MKYAVDMGMSQSDADGYAMNPIVAEMGYKAMMYDRMQAKAAKPKSRPAQTKPVVPMIVEWLKGALAVGKARASVLRYVSKIAGRKLGDLDSFTKWAQEDGLDLDRPLRPRGNIPAR